MFILLIIVGAAWY
ncbi:YjcZ family sporulation protein [Bacillus sp. FJAT-49682]|uniref:YjcZ family sporulation protein n=1 Tax=Lederbergia citrea TaxID=2833581 RepID=A0A942Z1S1_9BACI|nr:YjcZ family sporulation protein [Lederbergia citrea]